MKIGKLNLRQEKFCQLYTMNEECFGNGYKSYCLAYKKQPKTDKEKEIIRITASNLLTKINIQDKITELLLAQLNNEVVDRELTKLIMQNEEPSVKVQAIREYNKLKQRIVEKSETKIDIPQPIYGGQALKTPQKEIN